MARYWRFRRRPVRRSSESSRAIEAARRATRLSLVDVARELGIHPRTVRRWEIGEARPRELLWRRLIELYAARDAEVARTLAAKAGRSLPVTPAAPAVDSQLAGRVVATAADALDVAPKRVREVLRAAARASADFGLPFEALMGTIFETAEG